MQIVSHSPEETQTLAAKMAAHIISGPTPPEGATVIALEGELGAGKTTFVQGFTKGLGISEAVKSPTFLLIKKYTAQGRSVYHIDCYRINDFAELVPLEIKDIFADTSNIVLIEWSERIASGLPADRITVHLDHTAEQERTITISP